MVEWIDTLVAYIGDTTTFPVEITSDDVVFPITGHTLSWMISAKRGDTALVQIDVSSHTNPTLGLSSFTVTAAQLLTIGGVGEYWIYGVDIDETGAELTDVEAHFVVKSRPARTVTP